MKIRKILFGMTAGMMAVSSALVCQVSAGAVDTTLYSNTAVESWHDLEVDLSKAGIAGDDSSLEISCTAPEDAVDGHRLFNVIINGDWDNPEYTMSYDSSKTDFSVTVPGSELKGKSSIKIQAGDVDVKLTVKAVDFEEDKRATADVKLDLPINISMTAYTDENNIGAAADYSIDVTDQFSAKTMGEMFQTLKGVNLPAGKYFSDSLGVGADGFEMNIGIHGVDSSGNDQWGCSTNTVSYADGGFISLNSGDIYYPGTNDDTLVELDVTIRPRMEYNEAAGKQQAVSEKVRNLKSGDKITIQTAEDKRTTADLKLDLPVNISMTAITDEYTIGTKADYYVDVTDQFSAKTMGELLQTLKGVNVPAGKYFSDSLGLGVDGYEMNIGIHGRDSSGNDQWGGSSKTVSYADGGFIAFDDDNFYYTGANGDTLVDINIDIRPRMKYVEAENKDQAVSEKVRNLKPGDQITIQTVKDTRSEITIPAPKGSIVMYCFQDEWNEGTMACGDIPASSVSGITSGKTTVKELKEKYKTISASGNPVYTKDSLNLGKDAFTYAVWLHMKNGSQEDWWRGTLVSFDETAVLNTEDIDSSLDDYAIEEIGFTVYPVIEELPNGKSRAVNEKIRNLDPNKTEKIYINGTEAADDDEDDIKYDGLGEVKAEGNVTFKAAEWNPSDVDMTVVAIDPSWIKTEDDIVIVKLKYNKAYYDEWVRLVVVKNDGDYNDFYVEFDKRDFNIHFRAGAFMEKWGCKTVKELTDLNLSVQLWNPELGDNVNYQVSVISPKFEEKIDAPADKPEDYVPPTIEVKPNTINAQTTGVKPSKDDSSKKVYDTRFVMSVSSDDIVSGAGLKMVAYITIKRLDTNQTATISTTICYDKVSAVGDTISAGDGQKLLAFAVVNIPAGVDIEYTSILMGVADV